MVPDDALGRVLVVDDSPLAVDMLQQSLRAERWDVVTATESADALYLAGTCSPDVIVSDLYMPGMDGLEFLSQLRAIDATVPLVMTSSEDNLSVVLRAVHAGVYDYVPKSSDSRVLCAAVSRAAEHARAVRENLRLQLQLQVANQELEARVVERTAQLSSANQELQRLMGQLVASERLAAIGQLAAGIAHEINNPLSYVMSNLSYVRDHLEQAGGQRPLTFSMDDLPKHVLELAQALNEAEDGANRIAEIVRDVRTMSRTDDRSRGRFDINAAVRSATRIAGEQIRRRSQLRLELTDNLEVIGSVGRLTQVFINLLVNAADAIEEAKGREHEIRIKSVRLEGRIIVTVSDTGTGIDPARLERLFEPFYTTKPEGRGTGLGLSICRDILGRHSGTIRVESALGKGTSFIIDLPAAAPGSGVR